MTIPCYQIPYAIAGGPANMALDEALLEWVAGRSDAVFLRTYGWLEPTLTLGYFQSLSEALAEPRWQWVPLVRRATGGGAIWHDHELTYAVVLPAHHARARPSAALYQAVHAAIAATLRGRGWTLAGEPLPTPRRTAPRNDRRVVPFCALPTVTPRISWPVASRWWEVLSDAAPGQSSNTVRCSSSNQTGPPNSWESATWPGSPRTLAFGLDLYKRRLPGRWSSNWSHAICPPPSAAGPPSWKKRFIGSPPGQDGAELCHTKLDDRATFKKEQRKRCVPRIRRRQVCQGSWNSETFSYNVGEYLGGNLLQSTLDSS